MCKHCNCLSHPKLGALSFLSPTTRERVRKLADNLSKWKKNKVREKLGVTLWVAFFCLEPVTHNSFSGPPLSDLHQLLVSRNNIESFLDSVQVRRESYYDKFVQWSLLECFFSSTTREYNTWPKLELISKQKICELKVAEMINLVMDSYNWTMLPTTKLHACRLVLSKSDRIQGEQFCVIRKRDFCHLTNSQGFEICY